MTSPGSTGGASLELLRQGQDPFRLIVDSMAAPVAQCSRDLRYLWASKPYAAWLGRSVDEIVGRPIAEVIGPEALQAIRPHVERVLAGEPVEYEDRIFFQGLGWRWVHVFYRPTFGAGGTPNGWVAVVVDVDRSRRETALLEQLFQADPGALALLSGWDLRFLFANEAYRRLMLRPGVEPVGRTFASVWPEGPLREVEERLRGVLLAHAPLRVEREERICGDGQRRVFTSHACPLNWEGQEAVLSALWETTGLEEARREAERFAEEAEARASALQAILDAIPDGLALYDPRGRITAINPAAERLLHLRPEERALDLVERWSAFVLETVDAKPLAPEELPVARALRGEVTRDFELRIRRSEEPEQRPTWVKTSAAPVRGRSAALKGAVATYTDVSRLHELAEEREDLFRMVSHDLRSPLAGILAHAQLLARGPRSPEDVRCKAESIQANARRMEAMIREMAEVVGVEASKARLEPRPVDVTRTFHDLLQRLGNSLPVERVRIEGSAPRALADPVALERVLVNLVTNALKYSPQSEPVAIRVEPHGDTVAVRVADRGAGLTPEEQRRIFDRFYRRAQDARSEGLGLGLYITRVLLTRMGGEIRVESAPGRGSVFTVTLPAADPASEVAAPPVGP